MTRPSSNNSLAVLIALAALVAGQWWLFETSVREAILPNYPTHHDQTGFLIRAYRVDAAITGDGLVGAIADRIAQGSATGSLLDSQAAIGFRVVEANRLGALSVGFLHFAAFEAATAAAVLWLTGSLFYACLALALVAASGFPFVVPGGIFDFRIDTSATCAFGIFVAALVRSRFFADRHWSVATGLFAAYLIVLRHNMLIHFTALFGAFTIAMIACAALGLDRNAAARRRGLFAAIVTIAVLTTPILYFSFDQLVGYYTSQFAKRGPVRAALSGRSALVHWLFYPYNVAIQHAGVGFALCVALAAVGRLRGSDVIKQGRRLLANRERLLAVYVPLLASIAVPLTLLTIHSNRSTVVGGTVQPAIVLLSIALLFDLDRNRTGSERARHAVAFLLLGFALHAWQHTAWRQSQRELLAAGSQAMATHYEIGRYLLDLGRTAPSYVTDTLEDPFEPGIAATAVFERDRDLIVPRSPARRAQIFAVEGPAYFEELRRADVVILQNHGPKLPYPLVEHAEAHRAEIRREVATHHENRGIWRIGERSAEVYIRRTDR